MCKQPLIILTGPTAVGKTSLSIKLAKKIGAQIISADSMQVYRHMDIGTAKITSSEIQGVKHYLIDLIEPTEEFNVTIFKEKALKAIEQIRNDGYIPMIVGGTGFYIQALLYDIEFEDNDADTSYRQELYKLEKEKGAVYLYEMLKNAAQSLLTYHHNRLCIDMFDDNTYADACLTRITDKHHTYRLEMNGINMRETE